MAAGLSSSAAVVVFKPLRQFHGAARPLLPFPPSIRYRNDTTTNSTDFFRRGRTRKTSFAVCFVLEETKQSVRVIDDRQIENPTDGEEEPILPPRVAERLARKKSERTTYLVAAVMSTLGITSMAVMAVYYRFHWEQGGEVPLSEMFGTFALSVGAAVGMEFWARWAHKALWHASLWEMHESHHRPREGPFELNDVFAIINAVPAIALLSYGFFTKGLIPGLCFGAVSLSLALSLCVSE
ncbi:unnamed protein product [Linum tenue]|uniref:beta-carotene 3-hydroxylase n=1 Tax=Linum tenue TaxID=586396 RepID=A0AAV0QNN9_9ROSI|nr:unnamed protein product [Linum tenue]